MTLTEPKFYNATVASFTLKENTCWNATDFLSGVILRTLNQWYDSYGTKAPPSWLEGHNLDAWEKSLTRAIAAFTILCSDNPVYDYGVVRAGLVAFADILPYLYIINVNKD